MSKQFKMRLQCHYAQPDNSIGYLEVELYQDDAWQPLALSVKTPGFDVFCYSVFTCQHTYFRLNAAEAGIQLETSKGEMLIETDDDWHIQTISVSIDASYLVGEITQQTIDYIIERMHLCPVSINLKADAALQCNIAFHH